MSTENMLKSASIIDVTQAELIEFENITKEMGYDCNDWSPTLREIDEKLIGRYYDVVREKMSTMDSMTRTKKSSLNELNKELKNMLFYMKWILDTCVELDDVCRERLSAFVANKLNIVD